MIDKLISNKREISNVYDFEEGELYLQHCQQRDGEDSPEDILRIFRIGPNSIFGQEKEKRYGIAKNKEQSIPTLTLTEQLVYTTNLNPEDFDKGNVSRINLKISFEDYMGHFYHIPNGYKDIESLFGVHFQEHERMERSTSLGEKVIA